MVQAMYRLNMKSIARIEGMVALEIPCVSLGTIADWRVLQISSSICPHPPTCSLKLRSKLTLLPFPRAKT